MGVRTGSDFLDELDKATYANVDEKLLLYHDEHVKFAVLPVAIAASTSAQLVSYDKAGNVFVLPNKAVVKKVYLDVATAEATATTKTLDIGIYGGDEDGFLDGVSAASAATVRGSLAYGAVTLGALMKENTADGSAPVPKEYICTADTRICYTFGSNDFADLVANIIVEYLEVA